MKKLLFFLLCLLSTHLLPARSRPASAPLPTDRVTVSVHPGIELFTVVQLLAGQYPMPKRVVN